MTPEELRRVARQDARGHNGPPMSLHELQRGLALIARDGSGLDAAFSQLGALLKFLQENGTDRMALAPTHKLAEALIDLLGGNSAPMLKPRRLAEHKEPRGKHERRELYVALLVEAFIQSAPAEERRVQDNALETVADALKSLGIERAETERQERKPIAATAKEYLPETLRHWWRNAKKHEDWQERIDVLNEAGRWPKGRGDIATAEAMLASWLPKLADDFRGE